MSLYRDEDRVNLPRMRMERVEKAREQMKKDGIGAYLCFERANIQYLTDTYTYLRTTLLGRNVLFPRTGDPILYEEGQRYQRVRDELCPWLKGNVKPGWRLRWYLWKGIKPQEFIDDLKKTLSEHGVLNEPLALDLPILHVDIGDMLRSEGLNVVDGFASLNEARFEKTQDEIECERITCRIAEECFAAIREAIRPGLRESDIDAMVSDITIRRECDGPAELVCNSGPNTNPNMMGYSDRPIQPGDMIFIDIPGIKWRGYHSCVYRCFTCGRATQKQKELYAECLRLLEDAQNVVKAGVTTADICAAWPGPEHWGAENWRQISDVAIGHGLGLDNQEAPTITPLFSFESPITLTEGMVIALETWFGTKPGEKPTAAARIENDLVVTKDGYEMLTLFPDKEITECWI